MSSAPDNGVFQIPELLASILFHLPAKKVFAVQRVSKAWKAAIVQSPSIQTKLFLRLDGRPRETWELVNAKLETKLPVDKSARGYAREHRRNFRHPIVENGERFRRVDITQQEHNRLNLPISLNPLLQEISHERSGSTCVERALRWHNHPATHWYLASGAPARYLGTIATLARRSETFLSDAPCHQARIEVRERLRDAAAVATGFPFEARLSDIEIESASGLQIADINSAISHGHGHSFEFDPYLAVHECDNLGLLQAGLTRANVHAIIEKKLGWEGVASEPKIDVFVYLKFDESHRDLSP